MKDRYDISVDMGEGQKRLLDELDPMAHDLGFKPIADTISFDIGEGKDKGVQCWIRIGDDYKYIPATVIDTTTTISFADSVQRSGYVGVESGELSFSAEVSEHSRDIIRMLFGWSDEFNAQGVALKRLLKSYNEYVEWVERFCSLARKGKRRKTTYKTIRRDCAKRNRHR